MRRNLITLAVAAAIVAGLVVLNRERPSRLPADRIEASQAVAERLEEADEIEERYDDPADEAADNEAEQQIAQSEPSTQPALEPPEETGRVERYRFETTEGDWILEVYPDWAPIGAARFKEAVEAGVYNDAGIFRVVPGFVIQFGVPGEPDAAQIWSQSPIKDEPVLHSNERGTITFAKSNRPNSRTTQLFINLGDNEQLDDMGFAPFGKVVEGMEVVENVNAEYGEEPNQSLIKSKGNLYLREFFPNLDYIKRVTQMDEQ